MSGFPGSFWWGTAASATQTEGAAPASDWRAWELAGRAPESGDGNGFATRYREDFALLADWGLTHHRLSLDWARLEPVRGQYDRAAVEHYREVLAAGRSAGLRIWVCLLHSVLPRWFAEAGGFLAPDAGQVWARHVDFVADTFGDLVFGWKPVNAPASFAARRYLTDQFPPGHVSRQEFAAALRAVHLATVHAALRLRGGGQPVASVHALAPISPADPSPGAADAARALDGVVWGSWLALARSDAFAEAFDHYGFSYYYAMAVDAAGGLHPHPSGLPVGPQGYVRWAEGLGLVLRRLGEELPGRSFLVSELGWGGTDDLARTKYLRAALAEVRGALGRGLDLRGVFFWTGIDNYEWLHGHRVPYGLFDLGRQPRGSAHAIREIITRT
ncbi:glycoside hydrolase family 1 protein [Kutzneria viridogrisea]|uniref:Beta-glucosidase n=1 Tax=Kutzneria viridogrisea TaxID=47990 RepID=A0ABR6BQU6_9PSEU|nr:beta-glucosidase [Kutzneria viridogrisea]